MALFVEPTPIFIASRYAAFAPDGTWDEVSVKQNEQTARDLCQAASRAGFATFASHIFYTQFMSDSVPGERDAGIAYGRTFIRLCKELWYFPRYGISSGMTGDIAEAQAAGLTIRRIPDNLWIKAPPYTPEYRAELLALLVVESPQLVLPGIES